MITLTILHIDNVSQSAMEDDFCLMANLHGSMTLLIPTCCQMTFDIYLGTKQLNELKVPYIQRVLPLRDMKTSC